MSASNISSSFIVKIFTLVCLCFILKEVPCTQSLPIESERMAKAAQGNYPVVYKRYYRRHPSDYLEDLYMDEFFEIFHINRKPPTLHIMSDEEIDKIIRCDFEPSLEECKELYKPTTEQTFRTTTIARSTAPKTTTTTTTSTTPRTTTSSTTLSTTASSTSSTTPSTTSTTSSSTTTVAPASDEDLPFFPNIPQLEEEEDSAEVDHMKPETENVNEMENGEDYVEGNNTENMDHDEKNYEINAEKNEDDVEEREDDVDNDSEDDEDTYNPNDNEANKYEETAYNDPEDEDGF